MSRDTIFAIPAQPKDFVFDRRTAEVFDDMVRRSVPLYDEIQRMLVDLAARFCGDAPVVYDLGCSTGTTLIALSRALGERPARLIGIDGAQPMLDHATRKALAAGAANVEWQCMHIDEEISLEPCDVVIANLTLQFIRPIHREQLLRRLRERITPNGCLLLIEKVLTDDPTFRRLYIDVYHELKARNGYSQLEISQKREALENVLVPYRACENVDLLLRAGFAHVETFFRWFNFAGFLATPSQTPGP